MCWINKIKPNKFEAGHSTVEVLRHPPPSCKVALVAIAPTELELEQVRKLSWHVLIVLDMATYHSQAAYESAFLPRW